MRYYRFLADLTARRKVDTITSGEVGRALDVDPSQVRKDFAAIGLAGVSRVGYDVCEVCRTIRTVMGFEDSYAAVLVGAGQLGGALLAYDGFERYGLRIQAVFDSDPDTVGTTKGGHTVRSVHGLRAFIQDNRVPLAILTVPAEVAQGIAELVVLAGVRAIWNFSPTRLSVPDGVVVRNEHISMGLGPIAFHLHHTRPDLPPEGQDGAASPERLAGSDGQPAELADGPQVS